MHAVQKTLDVLDGVRAQLLRELREQNLFEVDGASSAKNWMRHQLGVPAAETSKLCRAADTMIRLPRVADAIAAGEIRLEHVNVFAYGLRHIGDDTIAESLDILLEVAKTSEPAELFAVMKQLRNALYPEELDEQWAKGAEKEHFSIEAVIDGFHVSGFLSTEMGARVKTVIDALAAPKGEQDQRSKDQRNVDALDELASAFLASGLPSDQGVRPHLTVRVDAETLHGQTSPTGEPATLDGFGPIGPQLLGLLACGADVTPVFTRKGFSSTSIVLSVGRTRRLATSKQRAAVLARQHGTCAAPGCRNTHLEIHHVIWWSRGGPTDLANLIGLCSRCHHLVHRERLTITAEPEADGEFRFTTITGKRIRDHRHHQRLKIVTTSPPLTGVA